MALSRSQRDTLAKGWALHQQGKLLEAEKIYDGVRKQAPREAEVLHLLGTVALSSDRAALAADLIEQALKADPHLANAHANLGNALQQCGRSDEALAAYKTALERNPRQSVIHNNIGIVYFEIGKYDTAISYYDAALELMPANADALYNRGNALRAQSRHADGLACYDRAIAFRPNFAKAHAHRGDALRLLGRKKEAMAALRRAVALDPDFVDGMRFLGIALRQIGLKTEANACFEKVLANRATDADSYFSHGLILTLVGRHIEAMEYFRHAGDLGLNSIDFKFNLGLTRFAVGDYEGAIAALDEVLLQNPSSADSIFGRGRALWALGRRAEAWTDFYAALAMEPASIGIQFNLSLHELLAGDLAAGFVRYEWRHKMEAHTYERMFDNPAWLGETDPTGKEIFVHWEQGLGDTIQMCRYLPMLAARCAKLTVAVQNPLRSLIEPICSDIIFIDANATPAGFDLRCSLMSLPLIFKTTLDTIPLADGYLSVDPQRQAFWQARLAERWSQTPALPRIGIVWSGNADHNNDQNRSTKLQQWSELLKFPAHWVALQKDVRAADLPDLLARPEIAHYPDEMRDFADTAALIDQLDLVIAADTSVAHLAGGLGKPVWILVPANPDWRWLVDRTDTPWYRSARLFRQDRVSNWDRTFDQLQAALQAEFTLPA